MSFKLMHQTAQGSAYLLGGAGHGGGAVVAGPRGRAALALDLARLALLGKPARR